MRRNIIVNVLFVIMYSLLLLMCGRASANMEKGVLSKFAISHKILVGYTEFSGNNHENK
ncbi:hypothetical protein C4A47_03842 [Escherichia coli]|nr:hypothetical protein C4A47_03842 [Escherichia coli]